MWQVLLRKFPIDVVIKVKMPCRYTFAVLTGKLILSNLQSVKSKLTNIKQMSAAMNTGCVKSLLYKEYGNPVEVLQVTTQTIEPPADDQVIVIEIKVYLFLSMNF